MLIALALGSGCGPDPSDERVRITVAQLRDTNPPIITRLTVPKSRFSEPDWLPRSLAEYAAGRLPASTLAPAHDSLSGDNDNGTNATFYAGFVDVDKALLPTNDSLYFTGYGRARLDDQAFDRVIGDGMTVSWKDAVVSVHAGHLETGPLGFGAMKISSAAFGLDDFSVGACQYVATKYSAAFNWADVAPACTPIFVEIAFFCEQTDCGNHVGVDQCSPTNVHTPCTCKDLHNDPDNCGACGVSCAGNPGNPKCAASSCQPNCGGLRDCGICVNDQTDNAHCGGCAVVCDKTTECCGGTCTNVFTNYAHCGTCGHSCSGMETCVNGLCQ